MALKLLIADDDRDIADLVAFGARMTWPRCEVLIASGGQQALDIFDKEAPDIVVLDVNMPPPDGFEVCQRIREVSQVPILMLTAHAATLDKIRGLDLGADDYITKPFDHLELLARLRALVRRSGANDPINTGAVDRANAELVPAREQAQLPVSSTTGDEPDLEFGDLSIRFANREVRLKDKPVSLTSTEYRLLEELARHSGTVLPHRFLLERVWGPEYASEDHYLKVFIRRLRNKLGDNAEHPRYIQTEWGIGYRFVPNR